MSEGATMSDWVCVKCRLLLGLDDWHVEVGVGLVHERCPE